MHPRPPRYVEGLPRLDRCLVMGVLNVTPDSFSDGGRYLDPSLAVKHGRQLAVDGADLVDVGGESTRPGAVRPSVQEEIDRVVPVVSALADEGVLVSVDTMRAVVAEEAVRAGAVLVNDVSGGRADEEMLATVARLGSTRGTTYVLMHWRAHSHQMQQHAEYGDVVGDVMRELAEQLEAANDAGIAPGRIAVDPGIGFSKTAEQNWDVLAGMERLHDLGHPVLIATSRKRFLGSLLADANGDLRPPSRREDGTTATSALAAAAGAWCIRAHAVRANLDAVRVAARWAAGARRSDG
ncbi:MAG: dihydropteroate synthase [Nocardioidaceae bacterium]|jgi:dihydropteroate synthase